MKRLSNIVLSTLFFLLPVVAGVVCAAEAAPADAVQPVIPVSPPAHVRPAQDFLEHMVDAVLEKFHIENTGSNTTAHWAICAAFLVGAFLLRHVVTNIIFKILKKLAERTETTLDDKLFPALEQPVAALITVTGMFMALMVLKLSEQADRMVSLGAMVAFSLVIFWGMLKAFNAILDHAHEIAVQKQMGIAAFMPWIKKTLIAVFVIIGLVLVLKSWGFDVGTILGAASIGGLAFAFAAQDTIANLFGSLVVAADQPFKIGETVRVGGYTGMIEDIGLRSSRVRLTDKSLVVIPNKLMASEAIVNLSRFTQRRIDQVIGLTYDTTPEQMETILADLRALLAGDEEVVKDTFDVNFTEFAESSLNIQIIYYAVNPDFRKHLVLRERINLKIMRAVTARGLSMAFPTQTLLHDGPLAKQLFTKQS